MNVHVCFSDYSLLTVYILLVVDLCYADCSVSLTNTTCKPCEFCVKQSVKDERKSTELCFSYVNIIFEFHKTLNENMQKPFV